MKRQGILHAELAWHLARLGHTDTFVIGDCGLPTPPGVPRIDLAVVAGVPRFTEVCDAILAETEVEGAVIAEEAHASPAGTALAERFPAAERVTHEEFKRLCAGAHFMVRTGETTPFANVILRSGVPF